MRRQEKIKTLFQNPGAGMFAVPLAPGGVSGRDLREPSIEVYSLNTFQSLPVRIPEGLRFPVIENKGIVVCPS